MTGTDLAVMPATGEVIDLAGLDRDDLVTLRAELADLSGRLEVAKRLFDREITRRIDLENETAGTGYTWRTAGYKVSVDSPTVAGRLDVEALRAYLVATYRDLDLDSLFARKIVYTLRQDRWRNAAKQHPEFPDVLKDHQAPATRRVKIVPVPTLRPPAAIDSTAEDA
jgi:hypothetical protein